MGESSYFLLLFRVVSTLSGTLDHSRIIGEF